MDLLSSSPFPLHDLEDEILQIAGETPGILPAWARDSGRTRPSFCLASVLMLAIFP